MAITARTRHPADPGTPPDPSGCRAAAPPFRRWGRRRGRRSGGGGPGRRWPGPWEQNGMGKPWESVEKTEKTMGKPWKKPCFDMWEANSFGSGLVEIFVANFLTIGYAWGSEEIAAVDRLTKMQETHVENCGISLSITSSIQWKRRTGIDDFPLINFRYTSIYGGFSICHF